MSLPEALKRLAQVVGLPSIATRFPSSSVTIAFNCPADTSASLRNTIAVGLFAIGASPNRFLMSRSVFDRQDSYEERIRGAGTLFPEAENDRLQGFALAPSSALLCSSDSIVLSSVSRV